MKTERISTEVLIKRIERCLAPDVRFQRIAFASYPDRVEYLIRHPGPLGALFLDVDPEALGRKLGALRPFERVAP